MTTQDFDFGAGKDGIPDEEVAPDGVYLIEIASCEFKYSKGGNGKPARPMLAMRCQIAQGPYLGATLWHNMVFTEENVNAKRMFYKQLELLGITQPGSGLQLAGLLKGRTFRGEVGHREWNGTVSNTVEKIISLEGAAPVGGVPGVPNVPRPVTPTPNVTPTPQMQSEPAPAPVPTPAPAPQAPAHVDEVPF